MNSLSDQNKLGNDSNYVRVSEKSLLQAYEKGIDNLTIDPANRQKREIRALKIKRNELELLTADVAELKQMMRKKSKS